MEFCQILRRELEIRCRSNPAYSLRAFSNQLEIDHSTLSKILRGKLAVGKRLTERLGSKLGYDDDQLRSFWDKDYEGEVKEYEKLDQDGFNIIRDWEHYAIMELIKLDNFKPSTGWIAKKLGIGQDRVKAAVARLKRVKLIQIKDGKWTDCTDGTSSNRSVSSHTGIREHQRQVLELAQESLQKVDFEYRTSSSMTMAIDKNKIAEAKEMILKFRRQLSDFLADSDSLDEVYNLCIALYPLTDLPLKEKKNV